MTHFSEFNDRRDRNAQLVQTTDMSTEKRQPENALERYAEVVLDKTLEAVKEENPLKSWMETAAPFLRSGGRPVAVILALGFISIPLMVCGGSGVAFILATGASVVAICSCF